jgi:hypothetical protein
MNMKRMIIPAITIVFWQGIHAQNIGINSTGANPDNSAMLDVVSSNRGVLVPRVALTATNAAGPIAAPATSLLVYNTVSAGAGATAVTPGYYYNAGTSGVPNWARVSTDGTDWKLLGNAGTTSGTNFLGTTDGQALDFRTNNAIRFRVANGNQVYAMSDGTAALPFYSWNSDVNTGIWRSAADNLSISTNGTETMRSNTTVTSFMQEIRTRQTNANAGDVLVHIHDNGADDGVVDFYQNNVLDSRISANGISYINATSADNRTFVIGDNTSLYPTFDVLEAHAIGSAGGNNYAVNAYSDGTGDCVYSEITSYGGGYGISSVNTDNTITGTQAFNTMEYVGTDVADHRALTLLSEPAAGWGIGLLSQGGWYGVYSLGDYGGSGAKYFMIDHPLDPENKYLRHACIESNEVLNHYRGNVVAGANGEARVYLPDYFHEVNINFSYLLTPVGSPAPNMHVSQEIDEAGMFIVSGLQPGQKVSWTVEAERNDLYLKNNPRVRDMEPNKRDEAIGKYILPELYNKPKTEGVFYKENAYEKKQRLAAEDLKSKEE